MISLELAKEWRKQEEQMIERVLSIINIPTSDVRPRWIASELVKLRKELLVALK